MRPVGIVLALLSAGCVAQQASQDGVTFASLDETVMVDGPRITPLSVLEDSRCPANVQCVWAGRVRISARIDLGGGSATRELTLGQSQHVADGALTLAQVLPAKSGEAAIAPGDYRFGFTFRGGL